MIYEKIQLEEGEIVLATLRRHWFAVFKHVLFSCVMILVPPVCALVLSQVSSVQLQPYMNILVFLYAAWLLVQWMMLAYVWTDQYLDTWTVTNRRIITVNQVSLFTRHIGSFRLERLQEITVEINGIFATLLDFGTIRTQTASDSATEFTASYLPKPQEVKALILKAADERIRASVL